MTAIHSGILNLRAIQQDPALAETIDTLTALTQLAARQAIGAAQEPHRYRLRAKAATDGTPDLTASAARWLDRLPAVRRDAVVARTLAAEGMTPTMQRLVKDHKLDLYDTRPVLEQLPASVKEQVAKGTFAARLQQMANRTQRLVSDGVKKEFLNFRIHRVVCEVDTKEKFKDEIRLAGEAFDDQGTIKTITNRSVGDFKKGDVKQFNPPLKAASFDLLNTTGNFPHAFSAIIVLAEIDKGGFLGFLDDLNSTVYATIYGVGYGIAMVGAAITGATGFLSPIGWAVLAVGGILMATALYFSGRADDIFNPQSAFIEIPTIDATFDGALTTDVDSLTFEGFEGRYRVEFSWELVPSQA